MRNFYEPPGQQPLKSGKYSFKEHDCYLQNNNTLTVNEDSQSKYAFDRKHFDASKRKLGIKRKYFLTN